MHPHRRGADGEVLRRIILPSTPPELLPAAISTGDYPALAAAVTCSAPNKS
ncbi:hypothetical protein [Mycobacterium palustre]|uniref:hypothetical protein n=1 Tax=Mycobacterium palustre TaxID=153971 RepID=UPI001FEC7030|nr:hypothetical protein [Mycobacterium palustre]